jgi:hypothetical protein
VGFEQHRFDTFGLFDRDPRQGYFIARHTYGNYTMEKSGNAFAASKSMGHADLESMEPYQRQEPEPLRVAINQCNRRRENEPVTGKCLRDWKKSGGRGRDRTYDQSIKSRMLTIH